MASKFLYNQAIADSNAINQSPAFNWRSALGLGNNEGTTSASMNVPQNMRKYFSDSNQMYDPRNSPHIGFDEMQTDGIMATDQAQDKGNFLNNIFSKVKKFSPVAMVMDKFSDSPQEKFNREYFNTAELGGSQRVNLHPAYNLYGNKNVSSMFGDLGKGGDKRIARIEKTIANLPQQWSQLAEDDPQAYAKKLAYHREKLKQFKLQRTDYQNALNQELGQGSTTINKPVIKSQGDQITTGGGQTDTSGWDSPGYTTRGGFAPRETSASQHAGAGATTGKRGHHSWAADGGRIGYQDGELVEQETDFIQGPQGGEEFQETVVEGEEQPSREQLEALAMHIFQLPLEELDEQQLVVVYQAAMQEQPMEEAVQEEDVQFAAQGGLAGLL